VTSKTARKKTVRIDCDRETAAALAEAIRTYAEAAYPPGGSECAQVAHQALKDTARSIDSAAAAGAAGGLEIPRRQRAMLKTAVDWYLEQPQVALNDVLRLRLQRLFNVVGASQRAERG
jgi:hypothetical protein